MCFFVLIMPHQKYYLVMHNIFCMKNSKNTKNVCFSFSVCFFLLLCNHALQFNALYWYLLLKQILMQMHCTNNFSCRKNFRARVTSKNISLIWCLFSNYYPICALCKRMGEEPIERKKLLKWKDSKLFVFTVALMKGQ